MKFNIHDNRGNLLKLASNALKSGKSISDVYKYFNSYLEKNKVDDDLADEIIDVLNILHGYRNPFVTVNSDGINCIEVKFDSNGNPF